MQRTVLRKLWTLGLVFMAALGAGCAPQPKNVSCSNDGECRALGDRLQYCLESRCVECVGSTSCGVEKSCDNGRCVQCINDEGCLDGRACIDGSCVDK